MKTAAGIINCVVLILLCMFAVSRQFANGETCSLEMGCKTSDFGCWVDCKQQYKGGLGGCKNKEYNRPLPNAGDDDNNGGDGGADKYCCQCLCKFNAPTCPKDDSQPPVQPPQDLN